MQRPGTTIEQFARQGEIPVARELSVLLEGNRDAMQSVAIDARYAGYLSKHRAALREMQELDGKEIPAWLDYNSISHLRAEARENLLEIRPMTLGQALRISGITPADVTVLAIHIARGR